jgi:hypothetical protein
VGYLFCIIHRNCPFDSFSDIKKNGFDASLARIQSLSCVSAGFSFLLPTVFLSTLEDNSAANLLRDKDFLNLVLGVV